MKLITLAAAAVNTTPKDWVGNCDKIVAVIREARTQAVDLLCLPELCVTGYGCEDEFHAPYVTELAIRFLQERIVPETLGLIVAVGLPLAYAGSVYNVIAVMVDGRLVGFTAKQNLAGDGIHYEPRFFKAWPAGVVAEYRLPTGGKVPLGDLLYDLAGVRVAVEICEDAWVAGRPGVSHSRHGVDVILNPSASHFSFGKAVVRERFVCEGSRAFNCAYVYANLLGNEAGRAIYDGDCMIASGGHVRAFSERFLTRGWTLTTAVVDLECNRVSRSRLASYEPVLADTGLVRVEGCPAPGAACPEPSPALTRPVATREWEFARAEALGLFDYLRKTRCRGYALSLSGGADSAACATLVALMVRYADPEGRAWLEQLTKLPAGASEKELVGRLLSCAYQASGNSGSVTLEAATAVAADTGARFVHFDIRPLVEATEGLLASYLGRGLDWGRDDLTRQNIQARVRNPPIWAIANAENFLLITTSNRSEAMVGYCTMDGDTAGSLAPVAGIDKVFLREWLAWARDTQGFASLELIIRQAPTAELRPADKAQTDEADLGGTYRMINRIQKLLVVEKKGPRDIFLALRASAEFGAEHDAAALIKAIARVLSLWSRNQWKRERYAPSFHLDDENLDPRSWCRYPILSGNYEYELAELRREFLGA